MTLGRDYDGENVTGWLASEKLDGCRAYWDGKQFWTRGGNVIDAPAWFTEGLPTIHLDGEIYCGPGRFEESRLAVQHGRFTPRCRFVAFDAPAVSGPWNERLAAAARHVEAVPATPVRSVNELCAMLTGILKNGGEGVMLRNPVPLGYERGRSKNLLKLKSMMQLL